MNFVLATSRPWNESMAARLEKKTGYQFHLITHKNELSIERLHEIQPRYIFFPHWSYIIPALIFEGFECVIFHMTELPYGRGGSPLQNLILRGHHETKISALQCEAEMDAGPIYMQRPLSLEGAACEIFLRAAKVIEEMIIEIINKQPSPTPQQGSPTLFTRRKPSESNLFTISQDHLDAFFDFIRMLDADGYPKAYIDINHHRVEFTRVQKEPGRLVGTFTIFLKDT